MSLYPLSTILNETILRNTTAPEYDELFCFIGTMGRNQLPDYCAFAHSKKRDISVELCKKGITLAMSEKTFAKQGL
jgi:hypothetical protein